MYIYLILVSMIVRLTQTTIGQDSSFSALKFMMMEGRKVVMLVVMLGCVVALSDGKYTTYTWLSYVVFLSI